MLSRRDFGAFLEAPATLIVGSNFRIELLEILQRHRRHGFATIAKMLTPPA